MTNAEINKAFLESTAANIQDLILRNIAAHYGITTDEAKAEILDNEAECVLEYITGNARPMVHAGYKEFLKSIQI